MLDSTTKRKIDSARQILVGKVPDPKAQVEQITTALVYKFMDDMDKEAEELGGKAKFFTDDLKDFEWSKLLDTRYSGQGRMDLYVRAISAFAKAKQLPQLFRDIFKDAFLPYRDPETLSLFLKEIDNFTYDHSEDLGNAFEYLLSVLGSQGDAGQFRTPRHIIDFIVAVVDPKKNETVLDPACGTAGFLISAYKHIRKHNSSNFNPEKEKAEEKLPEGETTAETVLSEKSYRGDLLTPSERGKLMNNFVGYDISPDMVKLSLVNMYLHGFSDPKIYEYDTLTSEKHWGEQFNVILANPPFMSPSGGIRPHKRFSVQAKRSEVLFVDYILEHLNLKGRAGIIVPEGIIFKNETAYKQLRQMLVEDGLFAVVSLPPGVFNPYSGVKTSILLFDNQLAKKSDEILFLKIENDGFDLGAQRRKIEKNDLLEALDILEAWKQGKKKESKIALWVNKDKIAESGDYNLTGERYKETEIRKNQKWPMVELGELFEMINGRAFKKNEWKNNGLQIIRIANLNDVSSDYNYFEGNYDQKILVKNGDLLFSWSGTRGTSFGPHLWTRGKGLLNQHIYRFEPKVEDINTTYAYYVLKQIVPDIEAQAHGAGGLVHITKTKLKKFTIPLPPLEVQKEIVEQIEVKQNAISNAKEIIKNLERERRYLGQELRKLEGVEWLELGVICKNLDSMRKPVTKSKRAKGQYPYYGASGIVDYVEDYIFDGDYLLISEDGANLLARSTPIAFSVSGKVWVNNHAHILEFEERVAQKLVELYVNSIDVSEYVSGAAQPKLNQANLNRINIPLPPLEIQKQLVAEAEKEEEIIIANHSLIELMEGKIDKILEAL